MDGPLSSKPRTLPSSEATRRELLEVAAVTGKRVKSCLSLAALVEGREISTTEGLGQGEQLRSA
jgi:hypothetical protein